MLPPMEKPTWLWKKGAPPEGVRFDAAKEDMKKLMSDGWVDDPRKAGINVNGGVMRGGEFPEQLAYDRGEIPGIDLDGSGKAVSMSSAEIEEMVANSRRLAAQNDEHLRTIEDLSAQLRREKEEEADEHLAGLREAGIPIGRSKDKDVRPGLSNADEGQESDSESSAPVAESPAQPSPKPKKGKSPEKAKAKSPAKEDSPAVEESVDKSDSPVPHAADDAGDGENDTAATF